MLRAENKIEKGVAETNARSVWAKTQDVRDCIKMGNLAKNISDVEFIVDKFFRRKCQVKTTLGKLE